MLERTDVSIERICFELESFPRGSPARNRREYSAEDLLRLGSLKTKARRCIQCACDGRFCLIFGNGSLVHANAIKARS